MASFYDQSLSIVSRIESRYLVPKTKKTRKKKEEFTHFDGELFRIDLKALIKTQMRFYEKKTLGEQFFSEQDFDLKSRKILEKDLYTSTSRLIDRDELKDTLTFKNKIYRYLEVATYYTVLDSSIFIFIINLKMSKVIKTMLVDFSTISLDEKSQSSPRPRVLDLAWNQENDEAFVTLIADDEDDDWFDFELFPGEVNERTKTCFIVCNFSNSEKRRYQKISSLKIKRENYLEQVVQGLDEHSIEEIDNFIDKKTGLLKMNCWVNSEFEAEMFKLIDNEFERITKRIIAEEMIIDQEEALSVVRTDDSLYLYNRKKKKIHWKLPYCYQFLDGIYSGKIIAKFDMRAKKLNLFGVCKKKNQFDLVKEIFFQDKKQGEKIPREKIDKGNHRNRDFFDENHPVLSSLRFINFSYLDKKDEYLVALITEEPLEKIDENIDSLPHEEFVATQRERLKKQYALPQNLVLIKLNKNLEIVRTKAHKYFMDREIKISVSENKIVALSSIYADLNQSDFCYKTFGHCELDFFDLGSLEKIPVSQDNPDNSLNFKVKSPIANISYDWISSFIFIEPDFLILEVKVQRRVWCFSQHVCIANKHRKDLYYQGEPLLEESDFPDIKKSYLQLRLKGFRPETQSEKDRELDAEGVEKRKVDSNCQPNLSQRKGDQSLGGDATRHLSGLPILKKPRKTQPKKTKKTSKSVAEYLINRYKNSRERIGRKGQGPRKKPFKKKKKKEEEIEKYESEGAEVISLEIETASLHDLRVFWGGKDPFFCILKPVVTRSGEHLVVKYWNRGIKGVKTIRKEGYFKVREQKCKKKVSLSNLFYLTEGRVVSNR